MYLALPNIEHHNCTIGGNLTPDYMLATNEATGTSEAWVTSYVIGNVHTHTHIVCMYYVTLLPCVLKTEDMTEATANSSIFIFIFIFTFQEKVYL